MKKIYLAFLSLAFYQCGNDQSNLVISKSENLLSGPNPSDDNVVIPDNFIKEGKFSLQEFKSYLEREEQTNLDKGAFLSYAIETQNSNLLKFLFNKEIVEPADLESHNCPIELKRKIRYATNIHDPRRVVLTRDTRFFPEELKNANAGQIIQHCVENEINIGDLLN